MRAKKSLVATAVLALCFLAVVVAVKRPRAPQYPFCAPVGAEQANIAYQALVQRVKGGDLTIDFRLLRLACVRSNVCDPRGTKADLLALNLVDTANQPRQVVEIAERIIDTGFTNLEAHAAAYKAYNDLGDVTKAQFHLGVTTALLRSIQSTGDGKTKEAAFEVICDREEYEVLVSMGLPYLGSDVSSVRRIQDGRHSYDRWEVQRPKTGEKVVVFFNVDQFSPIKSRAIQD